MDHFIRIDFNESNDKISRHISHYETFLYMLLIQKAESFKPNLSGW